MSFKNSVFNARKEFSYILLAYGIFLIGQVSLLIFSIQGSLSAVTVAFLAKDVGLIIFVKIIYDSSRRKSSLKELKPHTGDNG
jgi:hypothetical protein